jgi:hypothetical protein
MKRWFNTAGPCRPETHYTLPVARRIPSVRGLIERKSYFVLHAPRQVGKTTALLALGHELTAAGQHLAVLLSMSRSAPRSPTTPTPPSSPSSTPGATPRAPACPPTSSRRHGPKPTRPADRRRVERLGTRRSAPARPLPRRDRRPRRRAPHLVLRQLRDGYPNRPGDFPSSLALVGLRDVRDYKADPGSAERSGRLGTASPFNIKVRSLTLRDFTADEVTELYAQHTEDTGQVFTPEASPAPSSSPRANPGSSTPSPRRPWKSSSLIPPSRSPHPTSTSPKRSLIRRQDTHLDSLAERLREPRVRQHHRAFARRRHPPRRPRGRPPLRPRPRPRPSLLRGAGSSSPTPSTARRSRAPSPAVPSASLPQIRATWLTADGRLDSSPPPRRIPRLLAPTRRASAHLLPLP